MIIKVENNIREILAYLEAKGYIWNGSHKKLTQFIPSLAKCFYVYEGDKTITYSVELSSSKTIKSFEQVKKEIPMKKSDLKPGMVVEYANKVKHLVVEINNEINLMSTDSFNRLSYYDNDLTIADKESDPRTAANWRIDKIYIPKSMLSLGSMLNERFLSILWERPKETILTMQEIADKFGIPVEQLKIKK